MRRAVASVCLLAALSTACSEVSQLDLTTLGRGTWQRPDDVVRALQVEPGAQVADLGAGEGYFLPYLCDAVGPEGRVFAVELDSERIAVLEREFGDVANLEIVTGDPQDPKLPDGEIELVLLVNTYHHIEDREHYFEQLRHDLADGAAVAIIEPDGDLGGFLTLFLETGHTSRAAEIRREMAAAGYQHSESFGFLPVQIFEVFRPN